MFKNYLKIAFRNFIKQKVYSFITISGLAIGITCCLLILLYVKHELSYDKFYPHAEKIYRVAFEAVRPQGTSLVACTPTPLAPALKQEYPEIEYITRVYFDAEVLFEYGEKRIYEYNNVVYADPDFFNVFPFEILKGDPSHLLDTPDSMVLTALMAQKYFGDDEPLGKVFRVNKQYSFRVTGVIKDVPVNSHYRFGFVISFLAKNEKNFGTWLNLWTGYTNLYTYAVLPKELNIEEFTSKVEDIITRHSGKRPGITRKIFFQPLTSIYLHSDLEDEISGNSVSNLIILSTIAFLILVIACINYMNLATAQSAKRTKEVGMRKVLGAERFQLIRQFMGESILLTLVSLFLSLALVEAFLPTFSSLVGKPIDFVYKDNLLFLAGFFSIAVFMGAVSSIYPAVFLSRHQPIKTLKGLTGSLRGSIGQLFFKKTLVVIQFSISILLIVCTIVIMQQLRYMKNSDLGFEKEHTVVVPVLSESGKKQHEAIKRELLECPDVIGASACLETPIGSYTIITRAFPEGRSKEESYYIEHNFVDYDFLDNFNIKMVAGRKFSREYSTDFKEAFIINEAAVRKWGLSSPEEALGKRLRSGIGIEGTVIGVTEDYHVWSFHKEIAPLVLIYDPEYFVTMAVKVKPDNISQTLASIEKTMAKFIPEYPFAYTFLDEDINEHYQGEEQTARIIRTFSIIAIFIACLGLFGLAAFSAEKRTKEIGIRKVLGATTPNLIFHLSTEFTKWVLLANIIAWPVAYYAMNRWLQSFAYRINIGVFGFILAAGVAFLIALITVSYQAVKTALANPVKSLRYE
jgi:putative ABC transport system permease protein